MVATLCDVAVIDAGVQKLSRSRDSSAVLKARLISLRSALPCVPILAVEGVDDKIIYARWIGRLRSSLVYEPLICRGKDGVLALKAALERDQTGLEAGVYFFIDRDFDGLKGSSASKSVFLTEGYSLENYLVSPAVLDKTLIDLFHCDGRPDVRSKIVVEFERVYAEFLSVTKQLNIRIYIARKCGVKLNKTITDKISDIAQVSLGAVVASNNDPSSIITYIREISEDEIKNIICQFGSLDPAKNFRGKFALMFFRRWLDLLADDFDARQTDLFSDIKRVEKVRRKELTIGHFASCSDFPPGLDTFVQTIDAAA
jgi:hypothetical protein